MNKVFKVIWNHATQSWVAVSELTSAKGKTKSKKLTALSVAVGSALVGTPALAAVYVNNQQVTAAGSGSRIIISTGSSQTLADKITPTTAMQKYDNFIRIGDAGNPIVNDGQILIGYGINNQSSGEAGDTFIGHKARMGGGNLDSFSTGVGYRVQSAGPSVSIGVGARSDINSNSGWNSTRNGGVAIGAYALQGGNKDGGVAVGALSGGDYNYITSIGTLSGVGGFQIDQVKNKGYRVNGQYEGNEGATSIGYSAGARGLNSVAVGREATTADFRRGRDAVSVGYSTHSIGESSVALGPYAVAGGFSASEITALETEKTRLEGVIAEINSDWESARDQLNREAGIVSTVEVKFRMGQLLSAREKAQQELNRIKADLNRTSATPTQSTTTAMAIGYKALANNLNATAIGRQSQASAISAVALGTNARVNANLATSAIAIGKDANVLQNSTNAIALGMNASVVGDLNGSSGSIAIGSNTAAGNKNASWGANRDRRLGFLAAQNATAVGSESIAGADNALTLGYKNTVNAPNSSAIGSNNTVGTYSSVAYVNNVASATYSGVGSHVLGSNINVTANNTMVIGNNILVTEANRSGSVVLGDNSSVPTNTTAINSAKVGNITYSGFAGNLSGSSTDGSAEVAADQGRFVSIGNATAPRQIKHVAAGRIEADSTDAINGSQLYSLTGVVSNMGVSVANVIGGNAVLNPNGTVSGFSQPLNTTALSNDQDYTAPTTPAANVSTAITNLNNYVNAGWKIAQGDEPAAKARISPNEQVNFKADGLATVSVAENTTNNGADVTYSVKKGTFDTTTNGTVKANSTEGVVTNADVATAVNNSGWNTTLSTGKTLNVNPGDQVNYVNGNGTTANVTTTTVGGKDVVSVSYNVNETTGTVNPNGTVKVAEGNSFLNASTVANLVNNAAFNVTTAKVDAFAENQEGKANATVKAGGNITYTAGKNIAIKQAGTNFTFSTTKDVTFENATVNQTLTVGNGTNATNFTSTSEGLKVATSTGDKQAIVNVKSTLPGTADNNEVVTTERTLPTLTDAQKATAATVDDVLNAGWNLRGQKTAGAEVEAVDFVKPYDTVVFKSGNNATTDVVTTTDANNKVSTVTITAKAEPVKTSGLTTTVNNNGTVSVATGEAGTNLVNATTVANAINASGWNTNVTNATTGATETKVVTPGTQVDYVNGNGTTANVTLKDGKVAVSYNVNSTTGTVNPNGTVKVAEGNSFLNASTVANLVNNAAFNVTTAKVDAFAENQEGKANATVKAGGNITYTAGKNIAISQNGSNFTFSTTKDVVFNNAQVNSTLTIGNGTATSPKVNIQSTTKGLDMGNAVLTNVSSGITPYAAGTTPVTTAKSGLADLANSTQTNVVTVADAAKLGWVVSTDKTTTDATTGTADGNVYAANVTTANEVKFVGKGYATVSGATDSNGVRTITVSVGNVGAGKINADGSVTETKAGLLTAEEGTKLINGAGWLTNVTNATTGATETKVVTPGTQVDYVNGNGTTANVTLKDGKVAVSYNVNQTTGSVNTNGTAKVADGNSFLNASTVANLVNNAAFNVTTAKVDAFAENQEGKANATVKAGGNITYTAGKNIAISQNGSNFTFSTTKDIEVDSVTANNRVQIGSGNTAVNLTTDLGALKVADKDGNATQITNVDAGAETMAFNKDGDQLVKVGDKYYVVDPETGTSDFTTEGTPATEEELDELVKAKPELKAYVAYAKAASGLADLDNSVQTNALTVADAQRLGWVVSASGNDYADNVTNANEVRFNGVNGISVTGNTTDGVRNINISLNTTTLTSNANGTTTVTNGNNYVNGTTVADAINKAGWNTKLSDGTTLNVNPGDQVNYVSGKGTTANVTKAKDANGNDVVSVSYNVNQTTGSLNPNGTAKVADGNSFLNASTVANLVNNAAFNVTTAKVDAFAENQEGKANATVKAGGNITYTAGKNIAISQNGSNFTFSTTKDIEVDSVTANNRVQIGSGDTAVNLTTDLGALQVADKDGNATQITNVEAGTNIMAFNKEGDQLVKVGDKYYVVNPETNEVDYDQESTLATEEELDELAKAKPELKAYVSYAKAASGLADLDNSEQTNALTVADAQRLGWVVSASGNDYADSVTNANEVRFNGMNGVSVTGNTTDGVRNINISLNTTTLTSNANGTTTVTNGNNYVNGTTVANAINASGWNTNVTNATTGATETKVVTPGTQVDYVNGNGTTANVTLKDGKVAVSYNVNQTTGSVNTNGTAKVADGNSFLNASTVANLVNNAAFNVTTAKVDAFAENQEGKANATVKAGGNITYTAGKNIAISQNGSNFTFSTTKDIEVDSVTANNRVQIGSGNTAVNLTTDLGALKVADKDGNATQITNVDAGAETMAFNKEGEQLVKVGDKYYVVNPETGYADVEKESTPATEEELDKLAKAKPELKAYVAYAKAASGLADLDNSDQTNALTVADAQKLGWVVSAGDYAANVTNANEVRFNGSNGISVTGETDEHGVRNINVSIAKGKVDGNTTTGVATGDTNYVTGDQVANAINNSGWKTTATKVVDEKGKEIVDANKATAVNPGDSVNYVDGNSTKANVVVTKAADGKETVNVSYDLVTEDHLTPVANNAKSVTKPTNIDPKGNGKDAATVNDVLNAGWNLQANDEAVDAVTHGNNVNFTSKDGSVKITATSNGSTSSLDFAVNATSIVNQVTGTISYKDGKATTNGDGKRVATVGDVANTINNTGWLTNVTDANGNVTTKVVTPNTQVNYVNGDGTKANVVANSTTGGLDVTFHVKSANTDTLTVGKDGVKVNTGAITAATDKAGDVNRGKVTVATGEGNKVATVQNVADAINSASWTVKVADTQEEITTSTTNDKGSSVRAGNEITHVAGKNLKVKRDGNAVTYALANDVSVNTVTVGAGNAATTVTTSSAQDGVTEVKLADAAGKATRITNVAAGAKDTDAVNVSQLRNSNAQINQNIAHLNNKVNRMGKDLRAGIAGSNAAAGLPQVYIPGKSMVAAAAGTFKGQSAVAVGYSRASDNGKVILKLQGNANTRGEVGGSVGVGYQW